MPSRGEPALMSPARLTGPFAVGRTAEATAPRPTRRSSPAESHPPRGFGPAPPFPFHVPRRPRTRTRKRSARLAHQHQHQHQHQHEAVAPFDASEAPPPGNDSPRPSSAIAADVGLRFLVGVVLRAEPAPIRVGWGAQPG